MSTPMAARINIEILDGAKYFLSFGATDQGGAPLRIVTNSGKGAIKDSDGKLILDLPSVADFTSTGIITTQEGIFSLNILEADVVNLPLNQTFNFDISLEFTDFPEINPHKPLRGNITKLQGVFLP